MTNRQLAESYLSRFVVAREIDITSLEALLDMAEERGRAQVEFACDVPTKPCNVELCK